MNEVIITARLCKPIVVAGQTKTGENFAFVSAANNDEKDKPVYINGIIAGKQLDFVQKWIKPIGRVIIIGSLYDYKKDGEKYGELKVRIRKIEPIDWAEKSDARQEVDDNAPF